MEMLDHALVYAARGWPIFLIAPATKKPYPGSHGFKDAAVNEILLTRMYDEHPDADIGMATGKDADVWVLDVDGADGAKSLTTMEDEYGPIPETLEARTGGGGRHLFFRWPAAAEREIRNKQALLGHKGIDVRGEGGYVVCRAPGTRVLTRDLRWVPVESLSVGARLWAFDDDRNTGRQRRWRTASVTGVSQMVTDLIRVRLESGQELLSTPDHKYLAWRHGGRGDAGGAIWVEASRLLEVPTRWGTISRRILKNATLPKYLTPWSLDESREAGWFAGLLDGEGYCGQGRLQVFQKEGPVLERARTFLMSKGWPWRDGIDKTSGVKSLTIAGSFNDVANILGRLRPTRMLANFDVEGRSLYARQRLPDTIDSDRIVAVEPAGRGEVIVLSTSTGTFFDEGFGSHNCPPSKHPSGGEYSWPYGQETPIAEIPAKWLEAIAPIKRRIAPWERTESPQPATVRPAQTGSTPVVDRARRYLAECEPAVQGQGGHDKLLWAARAMVIGFGLDEETAVNLLWNDYNPRCSPPWDRGLPPERKEFERKAIQALQTPGEKPRGWLLDEYGLRSGADVLASIAAGNRFAEAILSKHARPAGQVRDGGPELPSRTSFPVEHFPPRLADYCRQVSEAHVVDPSFVALPMLAVAGAAMGNVWRLKLKKGFTVPPLLWVGLVAPSGSNKSGPLNEVMSALKAHVPIDMVKDAMLNPQGRMVVSDATLEAVISRLAESHRGLMVFRDELAGWVKSFNSYKKSGGDEQAWLEFWGAKGYHLDRKTNNEQVHIHAAAVSIMGGIQPSVLAECFDPGKFASGLVPRVLVACPESRDMYWSEVEVGDKESACWLDAILWLRTRPFAHMDSNTGQYQPHELELTPGAKDVYVAFFESMTRMIRATNNEHVQAFASKARVMAARLILIHRGLALSNVRPETIASPVGVESAQAGVAWMQWCLAEQMRIYGFAADEHARQQAKYLYDFVRDKGGTITPREVQRLNGRRFKTVNDAMVALKEMVALGMARWIVLEKKLELI